MPAWPGGATVASPGTRLGAYEVLEKIAHGAGGLVLRARAPSGREVAVKVLKAFADEGAVARFQREQRLLVTLGELEGFVPIIDDGVSPHGPFFVMPYIAAGSLRDRLRRGPLPVEEAVSLGIALARTMGLAHEKGVVHRDLKPSNVLLAPVRPGDAGLARGVRPLVADLGLAKHFRRDVSTADGSVALSKDGVFLGTPAYMAPEQMHDAKSVGPAADVYALGAILYECLTGKPPVDGATMLEVIDRAAAGEIEPLEKVRPGTPPWLAHVVTRALALDPGERPADARVLAKALEEGSAGSLVAPTAADLPGAPPGPSAGPRPQTSRIGDCEVLSELGRGATGVVLRARSPDGREVAIKVLQRAAADALARFERERKILESFGETEGFVPLLGSGSGPSGPYLVMRLLEGGTLRDRLRGGALGVEETIALGRALARALGAAHARGIVHRDLKPENILFAARGERSTARPLVGDLGLAKHFRPEGPGSSGVSLSLSGSFAGTAGYMAPEQMADSKNVGPAADVFALGAILYESLAGVPAFQGASIVEVVEMVEKGSPAPLRGARPETPRWLERVVEQALSRDPASRFPDGSALSRALEAGEGSGRGRGAAVAIGLSAAAAAAVVLSVLLPRSEKVEPTPVVPGGGSEAKTPSVAVAERPPLPRICDGFARSKLTRLASVWGSHGLKHPEEVRSVALSPDGKRALSGSMDHTIKLWDLATGDEMATLRGHGGWVVSLAWSADGRSAFSGSRDGTIKLWDLATASCTQTFTGSAAVNALALSPDGTSCLSGCANGVWLWDLASHEHVVVEWCGEIDAVAFTPDGKHTLTGGADGAVGHSSTTGGEQLRLMDGASKSAVRAIAALPDNVHVLAGHDDGTLSVFGIAPEELVGTVPAHEGAVLSLSVSGDGKLALSGGADATLRLWDVDALLRGGKGAEIKTLRGHSDRVHGVALSADGKRALSGSTDQSVRLWDTKTGAEVAPPPGHRSRIYSIALSPDGKHALTGSQDRTAKLWDPTTGKEERTLSGHGRSLTGAAFALGGKVAATASWDKTWKLWETASGRLLATVDAHQGGIQAIAGDGNWVLTGSTDKTAKVWQVVPAKGGDGVSVSEAKTLEHDAAVEAAVFSGQLAITGSAAGDVSFWNVLSGKLETTGPPHGAGVRAIASADDQRNVLTGARDGSLRLHTFETGFVREVLPAGGSSVSFVAFLDRRRGLYGLWDGTVHVIDIAQGELDAIDLGSSGDYAASCAVSPDGKFFLIGTARGVVLRFDVALAPGRQ